MNLLINGEQKTFSQPLNLKELLNSLELKADQKGLALCVNMEVTPRQHWETTALSDGDRIEIVIAAPGG